MLKGSFITFPYLRGTELLYGSFRKKTIKQLGGKVFPKRISYIGYIEKLFIPSNLELLLQVLEKVAYCFDLLTIHSPVSFREMILKKSCIVEEG